MSVPINPDRARAWLKDFKERTPHHDSHLQCGHVVQLLEAFLALDEIDRIAHEHIGRRFFPSHPVTP